MADELDKRTQSLIDNVKKINKGLSDEVKSIAERQKDDFQAALNARAFKKQVNAMLKDESFVKMANAVNQAEEAVRKTQNKLQDTLDNDETLVQKRKFNALLERQLQNMSLTEEERMEKVEAFNKHLKSINEREEVIRNQYNTLIEKQQEKYTNLSDEYQKVEQERIDKLKKLSDSGKFTTFSDSVKELSGGLLDIGSAFDDATKKFNAAKNLFGTLATPLTWTGKKLFGLGKQADETSDDLKKSNRLQKTNNRQLATTNKRMKMFNLSLLGSIAKFALMGVAILALVKFLNDKFGLFGSPEKVEDAADVASGGAGALRTAVKGMNETDKEFRRRTRALSNADKTIAKNERWIANNEEKLEKAKTDRARARIQKTIDQQKLEVENAKKIRELELDKGSRPTVGQKVVNQVNKVPRWMLKKIAQGATIASVGLTGWEMWNNLKENEQNLQTAERMFAEGLLTGEELNKVREVLMKKVMVENTATIAGNVSYFAIGSTAAARTARSLKGLARTPYTATAVAAVSLGTGIAATLAAQKIFDFANIDDALKLMYDPEDVLAKIGITPDTPGYEEFLANNKKFREQWENSTAVGPNGEAFLRKLAPGETAQSLGRKIQFGKGGSGVRMTNKELRDQKLMQPLISTAYNDFEKQKLENQKSINAFLSPDPGSLADFKETFKNELMLAKPNASADEIKAYVDANVEKAYEMKKAEHERGQSPVNVVNSVNQNSSFSLGTAVDTSTGLSSYNQLDGTIQSRLALP